MKALEKDRTRRYATASELAEDLARHLRCEPVVAGPPSATYKLTKFVQRHVLHIATVSIVGILALAVALLAIRGQVNSARTALERRESRLSQVQWLLDQGGYSLALEQAGVILANDETDLDASLLKARTMLHLDRREEAELLLLALLKIHPHQAAVFYLLAEIVGKNNTTAAEEYLAKAKRFSAGENAPRDYYLRSLSVSDNSAAIALLSDALLENPGYFEALMARCSRHYAARRFPGARIDAERARTLRPGDARTWFNLGATLIRIEDDEGAIVALERATTLNPEFEGAWFNLGMARERHGEFSGAIQAYLRTTVLSPADALAWRGLGRAQYGQRRFAEAADSFKRAVGFAPEHSGGYYLLGLCHRLLGDNAAALDAFEQLINLDPNHAMGLNEAAWIRLVASDKEIRDYDIALQLATKALSVKPGDPSFLGTLALAELRAEDYVSARLHAQEALKAGSESSWDLAILCWAEFALGHTEAARKARSRIRLAVGEDLSDESLKSFLAEMDSKSPLLPDDTR